MKKRKSLTDFLLFPTIFYKHFVIKKIHQEYLTEKVL